MTFDELCAAIRDRAGVDQVFVVAVSGFGGAGKSTLASRLSERLDHAEVVSGDDFSVQQQSERCDDWGSVDRARLREQVLEPARANRPIRYQQYDWPHDRLGDWRDVGLSKFLIVEGIGIIHPDLLPLFDMTIWLDVPLEIANERGRYRDKEIYRVDHDALWRDLWTPNDREYFERFRPDRLVDIVYMPQDEKCHRNEVAVTVIRDPDDRFFVAQRRADKKVFPLKWAVGAGGKVEHGEHADDAAARELEEETGIAASPSYRFTMTYEDDTLVSLMHVYDIEVERSSVGFDATEWCDSRWITRDELTELATETKDLCPDTAAFIRRYLNTEVTIDAAGVDDATSIAELIAEVERYYGSVDVEPLTETMANIQRFVFGPQPLVNVLLARVGGEVAGMAAYSYLWPASGSTQSMFLKELYVRPAYRRQGVARRFMDQLRCIAEENRCDRIEWTADKANDVAVDFYSAVGVAVNESKLFYRMPID